VSYKNSATIFVFHFFIETKQFVILLFNVLKTGEYAPQSTVSKASVQAGTGSVGLKPRTEVDTITATVIPKSSSQPDLSVGIPVLQPEARLSTDAAINTVKADQYDAGLKSEAERKANRYYDPNNSSKVFDSSRNGSPSYRDRKRRMSPVQAVRKCLVFLIGFSSFSLIISEQVFSILK
jgi:hypothetical protein